MDAALRGEADQTARPLGVIGRNRRDDEHRVVERAEQFVERALGCCGQTIDHFPVSVLPVTLPSAASFSRCACTE